MVERTSVTIVRGWGHGLLGVLVIALGGLVVGQASVRNGPLLLAAGFACVAAGLLLVVIGAVTVGMRLAARSREDAPGRQV